MGIVSNAVCGAAVGSVLGGTCGMAAEYTFEGEVYGTLALYSGLVGAIGGTGGALVGAGRKESGQEQCAASQEDTTTFVPMVR